MSDDPKIRAIPTPEADELAAAFSSMSRHWALQLQYAKQMARTRKGLYDAYVSAGFREDQALDLCKSLGL